MTFAGASIADLGGALVAVVVVALAVLAVALLVVLVSGVRTRRLGWLLLVVRRRAPDEQLPELDDDAAGRPPRVHRPPRTRRRARRTRFG